MGEAEIRERYGWAEIYPDRPVTAGATGTWRIVYHAGRYGVDDGGVIKIAWRDVSDWEAPRFDDPAAPGYASVSTTGPASLRPAFEKQRYVRPWRRCVTIDVFDDSLAEGDTVTLILGDTSGGSPGIRAQTFCKDRFEFRVAVDWCGAWVYVEVPSPAVPIVSGAPRKLVAVCASETAPGESAWVGIKAEDVWGNPCRDYTGEVAVDAGGLSGLPETFNFCPEDRGTRRFDDVRAPGCGIFRIGVSDRRLGLRTVSNPLRCVESGTDTRPFWGDLHGQSEETVGTNPVSSYFRFARESAFVDFAGHQGNDFQITEAVWEEIKRQANTQNDPGRFVAFVGYEWSGNTPVGGDRNVYYPGDAGPLHRSSHVLIPDESDAHTDCLHVTDLYRAMKGSDVLLVPHVGGRYANLDWHDPELERLVEVYSEWGEFEWFLRWALEKRLSGRVHCRKRRPQGPARRRVPRQRFLRRVRWSHMRLRHRTQPGRAVAGAEGPALLRHHGPADPRERHRRRPPDGLGRESGGAAGNRGRRDRYRTHRTRGDIQRPDVRIPIPQDRTPVARPNPHFLVRAAHPRAKPPGSLGRRPYPYAGPDTRRRRIRLRFGL